MNNLAISLKKFFTNKNTVTIIGVIAILVILYIVYTKTVDDATKKIQVPVAAHTINPQTEITAQDITYIEVASAAKPDSVLMNTSDIVGKYTGVGATVPEGSMFYSNVIVVKEDLPGNWLTLLGKDALGNLEIPYYFNVNTETTFGNSIQPNTYIDIYVKANNEQDVLMFGKMLSNIKVLAVTDSEGHDVFRSTQDIGDPAYLNFGLPSELHDLLKKAEYLNGTQLELIVVPHGGATVEEGLEINVSSEYLRDFIQNKTVELPANPTTEEGTTEGQDGTTTPTTQAGTTPTTPAASVAN